MALFAGAFHVISAVVWARAGYLGMLFFFCVPIAWLFRWLGGGMRDRQESEEFDYEVSATLTGCILGSAIGWVVAWLV